MLKVALLSLQNSGPALGLGYLISWFKQYSAFKDEVKFSVVEVPKADGVILRSASKVATDLKHYDLVGISTITQDYNDIEAISKHLHDINIPVIHGGHHVTALPHKLSPHASVGVLGEGEIPFQLLIELYLKCGSFLVEKLHDIDDICFRGNGEIIIANRKGNRIRDLDSIPPPDRSIFARKHFYPKMIWGNKVLGGLLTSRGCPYNCVFCSSSTHWGHSIRFFSPTYVVEEVKYLHTEFGVSVVHIFDDLGTIQKRRWYQIRDLLHEAGLLGRIEFHAQCRVNVFDKELCELFKELNFTEVEFGIEAGSQRVLDYLKGKKHAACTVEQNWEAIRLALNANIKVWAQLIVGSQDETVDEVRATLQFAEIKNVRYQICLLTPLPGTKLWQECLLKGLVSEEMDWSRLHLEINRKTFFERVYVCQTIPREILWELIRNKIESKYLYELTNLPLSLETVFNGIRLLLLDPVKYSKIYFNRVLALFRVRCN